MPVQECKFCEHIQCGKCGWKGVRKADEGVQLCGKCGSGLVFREPSRHVVGGKCRYARATNEGAAPAEVRDASTEGEGRMAMGNGGEGVSHEEGGAATGAGDQAEAHGSESAGAEGVEGVAQIEPRGLEKAVCGDCWSATAPEDHEICARLDCACTRCALKIKKIELDEPLPRWTVDSRTTDKAALLEAMAFRKPNGDIVAIMRNAICPDCGGAAVLFLADGDVVSYVRTGHGSCSMKTERD